MKTKYVFVCGLHRSGTSILAKHIAALSECTSFENTGAIMDEGQYLQNAYPPDVVFGGAGKFGSCPRAHLTESSPLLTPSNVLRLQRSWERFWDANKEIRIEKTPGNLLMTRFLQAAFPNSYFIAIKRHPVAVSLATKKWTRISLHSLFEHWLHCHDLFDEDKKYLKNVYEVGYEDYVENSQHYLREIADFIGTEFTPSSVAETTSAHNRKYFARWAQMLESSPVRFYYRSLLQHYEERVGEHGYSLVPPGATRRIQVEKRITQGFRFVPVLFVAADAYSGVREMIWRVRLWASRTAKQYCPASLLRLVCHYKATLTRRSA